MYQIPPEPETLTCPFCRTVIPYEDRLFMEDCYLDEDDEHQCDYTECCEDCFNKYA